MEIDKLILERAQVWLDGAFDDETKKQVKSLINNDLAELTESFYRDLEFGTGGLRGIMGVGTNRMNIYTVGMATQGLANYLKENFKGQEIKVAVAHDSRNNSRLFSEKVADIFASNGFKVYLFDSLRPTPELSFAIRELGCKSGVVVTASHNPKEYNGYKAYWEDGAQVTPPHDKNIIEEVGKITSPSQVLSGLNAENITILDSKFDEIYLSKVKTLSLSPNAVKKYHDMKIIYTPIHGTGVVLVPESLKSFGFTNVELVAEQSVVDGNFPTVISPNPEERATMKMALDLAKERDAELVIATDPDADRVGIAIKDDKGEYVLLNGNQTYALLIYYMMRRWSELGKINGNQYIVKTIVTSEMIPKIAKSFGVEYYDCLTGFKYIAEIIRDNEGTPKEYIGGGEESFGFLAGDFVRDKDAVSACSLAAEAAAWAKGEGMTLYDMLQKMYLEYGLYKENLVSVVRKGKAGQEEIAQMMTSFRENPPVELGGSKIECIKDYQTGVQKCFSTGMCTPINIERSNVLQFITADGTIISVRPSGTEPKIKFYFGVCAPLCCKEKFDEVNAQLDAKIESIKKELELI
ncbi:MAG: phospho-sugar mutase [Rikenellaceae bacterium]